MWESRKLKRMPERVKTPRKAHGEANRFDRGRRIGQIAARDVEGGPMIRRGAGEGKAERDVDPAPEGDRLERRHPHVVVGSHHRVELTVQRACEHGIRWNGTLRRHPFRRESLQSGAVDARLLFAEEPAV